jgi:hypothetical protein
VVCTKNLTPKKGRPFILRIADKLGVGRSESKHHDNLAIIPSDGTIGWELPDVLFLFQRKGVDIACSGSGKPISVSSKADNGHSCVHRPPRGTLVSMRRNRVDPKSFDLTTPYRGGIVRKPWYTPLASR